MIKIKFPKFDKRHLFAVVVLLLSCSIYAQENPLRHYIKGGVGPFFDKQSHNKETGLSLSLGYGLAYRLNSQWSIGTGLTLREEMLSPFNSKDGGGDEAFTFLDLPLTLQNHLPVGKQGMITFTLGPVFTFCIGNDQYVNSPDNPIVELRGKDMLKTFDLGIQPAITYETNHLQLGIEGNIGLLNVGENYGLPLGKHRISSLRATIGYCF